MFDLEIQNLRLTFRNAQGHEHRVAPIAERAMALLAEALEERAPNTAAPPNPPPAVHLDLAATADEQAARQIADVCLEALAMRL